MKCFLHFEDGEAFRSIFRINLKSLEFKFLSLWILVHFTPSIWKQMATNKLYNSTEEDTLRMCQPFSRCGRNIKLDWFFSSVNVVRKRLTEYQLTVVEIIKSIKVELPTILINKKEKSINSSICTTKSNESFITAIRPLNWATKITSNN